MQPLFSLPGLDGWRAHFSHRTLVLVVDGVETREVGVVSTLKPRNGQVAHALHELVVTVPSAEEHAARM